MESSLQEALEEKGLGRVNIVRLENTENGALGLTGIDVSGVEYKLLSTEDGYLATMAWLGNEGTHEMRIREGIMNFRALAGSELNKEGVLVGPAVKYASEAKIDERGAALWIKADKAQ